MSDLANAQRLKFRNAIAAPTPPHGTGQRAAVEPGATPHRYPAPAATFSHPWRLFTVTAAVWAIVYGAGVLVWLVAR
jgi:hypothetical protein